MIHKTLNDYHLLKLFAFYVSLEENHREIIFKSRLFNDDEKGHYLISNPSLKLKI